MPLDMDMGIGLEALVRHAVPDQNCMRIYVGAILVLPLFAVGNSMLDLFIQLNGTANLYSMDYRDTGRSTFLDRVAAQGTTTGSPNGNEFEPSEIAACARELEHKYGDLSSFSTTSAATDLKTFISKLSNRATTIVYDFSYGTVFVERLMHLSPPEVTVYVMDGVATASGASADKFFYKSKRDSDYGTDEYHHFSDHT
ncbi:unnamed protein product [Phytophthora fragariaefolia]|uniref:Unnamed protein product n=1 Tax=Phytophthora fragariaefolia TaxID=1490495 RepID=A0A9W6U481_9STRA|nr:unnamed protein product [Phytophthora fragariaefolia]